MSTQVTETVDSIAEKIRAKFLNGCSPDELSDLAHALEETSDPVAAAEVVDDLRSKSLTTVMQKVVTYLDRNEFGHFVVAIKQATRIAQVPVNGYIVESHHINWVNAVKKTGNYEFRRVTSLPQQGQHGYQERTQMGSP